ncbi:MAG: uroporphyrinogen-III synthase [Candidatus Cloacimonetes bacterium]|nr:uroporphyrinogen-III synthase [Candidatus Cloacimonadota bacterium]
MSSRALAGLRIAVTRTSDQASALVRQLEREGADVAAFPLIRIEPVLSAAELANRLRQGWDWVVFTSANAVRMCALALEAQHATPRDVLSQARIAVVGPATAAAVRALGLEVAAMPDRFVGDEVVAAMQATSDLARRQVLWPRAEGARDVIENALRAAGAAIDAPVVYRSVPDGGNARRLARKILQHDIDVVTFTSPSCVRSLADVLPEMRGVKVAAIGPVTAEAARAAGYPVDVVAAEHTADGIVRAVVQVLGAG